jgi:hypothetical protein
MYTCYFSPKVKNSSRKSKISQKWRFNVKNTLMHLHDKIALRKRAIIETINDLLKPGRPIEHTWSRWLHHLTGNLVAGLIAYNPLNDDLLCSLAIPDNTSRQ